LAQNHGGEFDSDWRFLWQQKNRPNDEVRLGSIRAAIWRNEAEHGARYSVTFERLYKEGAEWKSSSSFGRDELLLLAKVADKAHSRIFEEDASADG
jgi:hypothetical protein